MDTVPLEESHVRPQACPGVTYTPASNVSTLSWTLTLDKRHSIATCCVFILAGSLLLHMGFSLVALGRGYSLATVHQLLIAVPSLVAEHGL